MSPSANPFLVVSLLAALMIRVTFGAPCCWSDDAHGQAMVSHDHHVEHEGHPVHPMTNMNANKAHEGHGEDNRTNPCCSACGPTLPPEMAQSAARLMPHSLPHPEAIRELGTRPPFPAYDATGPPLTV